MYSCGMKAEDIVSVVEGETNSAPAVTAHAYCAWINMTEQLLYSDIIREQRMCEIPFKSAVGFDDLSVDIGCEDMPRFEDILHIYGVKDGERVELEHSEPTWVLRGVQADNSYYFNGHEIVINGIYDSLIIVRIARPIPKRVVKTTVNNQSVDKIIGSIALPYEFVEMLICRLRSEKYRLLNEDELCAKWTDKYNYYLENFKQYVGVRSASV